MKRKTTMIISAVIVLILCICLVVSNWLSPDIVAAEDSTVKVETSSDDSNWNTENAGSITIENDNYIFVLDCETTHFSITGRSSGIVYHSVAQPSEGYELSAEQLSEVQIAYYDSQSTETEMNSYENSVEYDAYTIKTNGSAIRVYYSIQKSEKKVFVPTVIGRQVFEEQILPALESGPARRLKGFYTLYESDADDSDTKEMKQTYSALETEDLYILNDTAGEHNYSEITGYMDTANYDQKTYAEEVERLGLEASESSNLPAAFVIPVEYKLTEDGFTATILTDKIASDSDNYQLTHISLLPYFASSQASENGWFMVPDGSGAIIEFAEQVGKTYSQSVWGNDMAVESSSTSAMMQNVGLPVFGFHNGEGVMFAEISGGAAVANLHAGVFGNEITQNYIYAEFNVLSFDTSNSGAQRRMAAFNIYSQGYVAEFPQVRYTLYDTAETTYSDMAETYRSHLIEDGVLQERLDTEGDLPVYIDFTGYEIVDEFFLGIATQEDLALSTLKDIENALDELEKRDVSNVHLRLKAYSDGGLYGTASNGFSIEDCVGTIEELDALAKRLLQNGGRLYLDNNFSTVYTEDGAYNTMKHAVRNLQKTVISTSSYNLVSRKIDDSVNEFYMTSPAYYQSLTANFTNELIEKSADETLYGYSWSDFGSKLWSDFNEDHAYDRTQTADTMCNVMAEVSETFTSIMTDGSNAYAMATADVLLNIPLTNSGLNCESYSIPFYQMVIHGYVDYAGAPMNVGGDMEKNYLAAIESGAGLYYSFYTAGDEILKYTAAGPVTYPTNITTSYDSVESQYQILQELFSDLRGCTITEHQRVVDKVFVTTYENGTSIAVNYTDYDTEVNGVVVPANGYAVVERGSN